MTSHDPVPGRGTGEDSGGWAHQGSRSGASSEEARVERELQTAFAPVHKMAFGIALGSVIGLGVALATAASILLSPENPFPLDLLSQFFAGYRRTWGGVLVGGAWGFFVGAVAGWFLAFVRNLLLAIWILAARSRAEFEATRDFLDHI